MVGYSVEITEASKELTGKQKIQVKDTTDCIKLDVATKEAPVTIDVDYYVALLIHNEHSDDKEYKNYIIVDKNGTRYSTGSESFWSTFVGIYEDMSEETEPWQIKVYRMPSKNRPGKDFITCSVI